MKIFCIVSSYWPGFRELIYFEHNMSKIYDKS